MTLAISGGPENTRYNDYRQEVFIAAVPSHDSVLPSSPSFNEV
jgi:hypothetical protein